MKFYNFKRLALIFTIVISAMSCQKSLDINTDPNNANTATPQLVMPTAQFQMGTVVGGTWGFIGSMWAQYWTGGYGVGTSQLEYYNMLSSDVNNVWTRAYGRSLNDYQFMIKSGQPFYSGVAKISQAYMFQMLCDLHGSIPMSEALKGAIEDGGIVTPKYDTETQVYDALLPMIQAGIDDITASGATVTRSEDIIYAGNVSKWIKFANTLKLKVLVRSGKYAEAKALMETPGISFISDATDECKLRFFETGQNTNPIYAQFEARVGVGMYYVGTNSSVEKLRSLGDPRLDEIYIPGTSGHEGVFSGDINDNTTLYPSGGSNTRFSRPNTAKVFNATVPVFFISSWESNFLQAEVLSRTGGDGSAFFEDAVAASCDYYGVSVGTYASDFGFSSKTADEQLDLIAVQKWISMNSLQMAEGWLETLRFDRTGHNIFKNGIFTSPINNTLGTNGFPSSFIYPTQENSNNSANVPSGRSVNSRRFWDAN
ncbi:MAG: SusD/RagB family nutrient-binding outer membrane lipoprotein [Chitinophagales bacterium]|nr:SusD/RagB family nutrient-binding outer membrane lipoprotein [Chitinophagales bacterium]